MKSFEEINEKIRRRKAVTVTADEMVEIVKSEGPRRASSKVDVVTTGTFGPMCSSGVFLNAGHSTPRMKVSQSTLNGVPAYCGIAAADMYIGATELMGESHHQADADRFEYGGGHVIEDLVARRPVTMKASAYGTDCYPRRSLEKALMVDDLVNAWMLNPRNSYQNYNVAVNRSSDRTIRTYMGALEPDMKNACYCSAGQLSPLLKDPFYRTIGVGTRIFLGGAVGFVIGHGTQHQPQVERSSNGVPMEGAGTLATSGDLKRMHPEFVRGVSIPGYGVSLAVGVGVPIPVLDEDMAASAGVSDGDIVAPVVDYSKDYWSNSGEPLAHVPYARLRSGEIEVRGRKVRTSSLSSLPKARRIAGILKAWIDAGELALGVPSETLGGEP